MESIFSQFSQWIGGFGLIGAVVIVILLVIVAAVVYTMVSKQFSFLPRIPWPEFITNTIPFLK